jgi:hypothetical protein
VSSLKYALVCTGASIRRREVVHTAICDGRLRRGRADSAEGVGARSGKGAGLITTKDGNPLVDGRLTVRRMRRVDLDVLSAWAIRRRRPLFEGEMYYKVVTRLLICDRELLHRDYAVNLQLASINPVNGIAIIAILCMQRTHFLKATHSSIRVLPCLHCRSEKGKPGIKTPLFR